MENEATTTNTTIETKTTEQCPKCGKLFKSAPALRMHTIRAHGKGWNTSANFRGKKKDQTRDEVLARKRAYNKKMRAENIAKGLTGSGKPRKRAYRPKNKPVFGAKWTPARRKKFQATWEAKKNGNKTIVEIAKLVQKNEQPLEDPREFINHCPNCGKSLIAYYLAAGAERRRHGK
jgi:predicted RNA-binding Zn-ribbon protein involved in translation (DUF1610 family)